MYVCMYARTYVYARTHKHTHNMYAVLGVKVSVDAMPLLVSNLGMYRSITSNTSYSYFQNFLFITSTIYLQ